MNNSKETISNPTSTSDFWQLLREEATCSTSDLDDNLGDDLITPIFHRFVLSKHNFAESLCCILTEKLSNAETTSTQLTPIFSYVYSEAPGVIEAAKHDILATRRRDPAVHSHLSVLLYMKGFHALQIHRVANVLYQKGRIDAALYLQHRASVLFGVDCHPAASIGHGVMFDHATGIVIGETAIVEDNVSLLQGVTLGGTGKTSGDRHPKVRSGVLIGAGAKILGNIEIGQCARVGAGSVVLKDVPAHSTVVGVPAKIVSEGDQSLPCDEMNHNILTSKE